VFAHADLVSLYLDTLLACVRLAAERPADQADQRGWMEREILFEYAQVREAALADPVKPFSNDEFNEAVEALVVFARTRGDFVTQEVAWARAQLRHLR
jgi:hypothetical protein